jgi:gas vesicle protein
MDSDIQAPRPYGFGLGLFAGTVIGAGLAMWLVPGAVAELRERVIDSAKRLGKLAGEPRDQVTTPVEETAEDLSRRREVVRDNIAETVAQHAHEVEAYAAEQTERATAARRRSSHAQSTSRPPNM